MSWTVAVTLMGGAPSGVESGGNTAVRAAVNAVMTWDCGQGQG